MNQEDFRKLLATPRPASSSSSTSTTSEFKKPDAISGNNTTNKSKKQQQIRNRKKQQGEGDAVGEEAEITEVGSSLYRDRAAERRKGINNDYAESENIIKTLTNR